MNQLSKLKRDLESWPNLPYNLDRAESKLKCSLKHGIWVNWYYKEDLEFAKEYGFDIRKECPYRGIIIGKPDMESHSTLCIPDCALIVDTYPCEKENCRLDWVSLGRALDDENLVEMVACPKRYQCSM